MTLRSLPALVLPPAAEPAAGPGPARATELVPAPEPATRPEPVPVAEPAPASEPVPAPEPATRPEPVLAPEPEPGVLGGTVIRPTAAVLGTGGRRHEPGPGTGAPHGGQLGFGVPLRRARRSTLAGTWARARYRRFAAEQRKHRSFWHLIGSKIVDTHTETLRQTNAYAWSLAWLKPYMTGWVRTFCKWENIIFLILTTPVRALGIGLVKASERQGRGWLTLIGLAVIYLIWHKAHH